MMFSGLPEEVIIKIFKFLTIKEVNELIDRLEFLAITEHKLPKRSFDLFTHLLALAYRRIYQGKVVISDEGQQADPFNNYLTMTELDRMLRTEERRITKNNVFLNSRAESICFRLVRNMNDYMKFLRSLRSLSSLFKESDMQSNEFSYLKETRQIDIYIDSRTFTIEPPTAVVNTVLAALIALSERNKAGQIRGMNLRSLTILSTDIGNFRYNDWCQLFNRFDNLTYLNLSDNILTSDVLDNQAKNKIDILGKLFKLPSSLKVLVLDNNLFSYVSEDFLRNLPSNSLEVLSMRNNKIHSFCMGCSNDFCLSEALPNLRSLDLSYNSSLSYINTKLFDDMPVKLSFGKVFLKGCNLDIQTLSNLRKNFRNYVIET